MESDQVELERSRTRESALRITFGVKRAVKALQDVNAELNGFRLEKARTQVGPRWKTGSIFHMNEEDLERSAPGGARRVGWTVSTQGLQSEYLCRTGPRALQGTIFCFPRHEWGDVVLKIFLPITISEWASFEVIEADRPIMVGDRTMCAQQPAQERPDDPNRRRQILRSQPFQNVSSRKSATSFALWKRISHGHRFSKARWSGGHFIGITRGEPCLRYGRKRFGKRHAVESAGGQAAVDQRRGHLMDNRFYQNREALSST